MVLRINVRRAETLDLSRIIDFNIRMAKETEQKELKADDVYKGVKAVLNDSCKGFYLVAETGKTRKIAGQLMVTFEWSDWRNKNSWWIQSVYVEPEARNQGVFTQLYRRLVELADSEGEVCGFRLYVDRGNETAKRVYESIGFRITSYEMYEKEHSHRLGSEGLPA
jgi:ribosomal protein S18 acetylase RimI-like enzyme